MCTADEQDSGWVDGLTADRIRVYASVTQVCDPRQPRLAKTDPDHITG
jgi:hypothetical protein